MFYKVKFFMFLFLFLIPYCYLMLNGDEQPEKKLVLYKLCSVIQLMTVVDELMRLYRQGWNYINANSVVEIISIALFVILALIDGYHSDVTEE